VGEGRRDGEGLCERDREKEPRHLAVLPERVFSNPSFYPLSSLSRNKSSSLPPSFHNLQTSSLRTSFPLPTPAGVYATREFAPFDVMGEYVGRVVPPEVGGEYVATIDWEDCRFADGAGHLWGVDSALYGSE
jgi:hypothetical protein